LGQQYFLAHFSEGKAASSAVLESAPGVTQTMPPKMKDCLIGVDLAKAIRKVAGSLKLKVPDGKLGFRCTECNRPVKPAVGKKQPPHFEHLDRNAKCSLSHVKRKGGR
jgi:hypothetical protein